eukprot:UN33573
MFGCDGQAPSDQIPEEYKDLGSMTVGDICCESCAGESTDVDPGEVLDGYYDIHNDKDCDGGEYLDGNSTWFENQTVQQCQIYCGQEADCSGFVWKSENNGKCKYYTGDLTVSDDSGKKCVIKKTQNIPIQECDQALNNDEGQQEGKCGENYNNTY